MTVLQEVAEAALMLFRLSLFALALGLTIISFQAYRQNGGKRLESAFIGFSFISMGVAISSITDQIQVYVVYFSIVETIPFIVGFAMLYVSLYR